MKKRIISLLACLLVWTFSLVAQDISEKTVAAFREGNSQELNKYLNDKIDLIIQGRPVYADRRKAEEAMIAFFSAHKVRGFSVNHQGKRDDSGFIIGTLTTVDGVFRVNYFFRKVEGRYSVHQIKINKTDE